MTLPISVVIPAYNRAGLLPRALASISAQRPSPPSEVIVVDDGSQDGTAEVAEDLGAHVIRLDANRGQAVARNVGIDAAKHPWVAFLDSDDEWLPHHLATLWALRNGHVLLSSSSLHFRGDPARNRVVGPLTRGPRVVTRPSDLLHPHNFVTTSTTLALREALIRCGGFRTWEGGVEDLDMWVRLIEHGTAVVSPTVTIVYHVEGPRISDDLPRMRSGHTALALAFRARDWWTPGLVGRWEGARSWDELRDQFDEGRPGEAVKRGLWLASRPARIRGALELLIWRFRARRASSRVNPDGSPTKATLLGTRELARGIPRLIRRPTALAVVDSTLGSLVARAIGITPVEPGAEGELSSQA